MRTGYEAAAAVVDQASTRLSEAIAALRDATRVTLSGLLDKVCVCRANVRDDERAVPLMRAIGVLTGEVEIEEARDL